MNKVYCYCYHARKRSLFKEINKVNKHLPFLFKEINKYYFSIFKRTLIFKTLQRSKTLNDKGLNSGLQAFSDGYKGYVIIFCVLPKMRCNCRSCSKQTVRTAEYSAVSASLC